MLFVHFGTSFQAKGGEIPSPAHVYFEGMSPPSWNTALVRTIVAGCVTAVADVMTAALATPVDGPDTADGDKIPEPMIPTRTTATSTTIVAKNWPLTIVTLRTVTGYIGTDGKIHAVS